MATQHQPDADHLRASDADRERVAELLREQTGKGRLTLDEFEDRLAKVYASRTFGQLREPISDLPVVWTPVPVGMGRVATSQVPPRAASEVAPVRRSTGSALFRGHVTTYATTMLFLVIIWALTGAGYFWPIWPMLGWGLPVALHGLNRTRPDDRH